MSLRSAIREMYDRGLSDAAVRAQLQGAAAPEVIRSSMSKVRRELGIVLRPDLCGPRAARLRSSDIKRPVAVFFSPTILDRLADEASARGVTRPTLVRRLVETALVKGLSDEVLAKAWDALWGRR